MTSTTADAGRTASEATRKFGPLKAIVSRPTDLTETLECGHTINRPLSLGECAMFPSKAKRRRCYVCADAALAAAKTG